MQPKPLEKQSWPVIDNVVAPLADWWRRHATIRENLDDLEAFGPAEMARMAQDVGIPASDCASWRAIARMPQTCSSGASRHSG